MHLGPHHHGHDHCPGHAAADQGLSARFAIAVVLNVLLVVGEALGGFLSGSMALLADAGHNLSDVGGLVLAWWAHWLKGRGSRGRWTYGPRAFTILAANLNGLLLVVAIIGIAIESIRRLWMPAEVAELPILLVASVAAILNFGTARLLVPKDNDLNVRGAYLHMLADALVSVAVVVSALVIMATGWDWLDPAIGLAICVVLTFGTWSLLRESTSMMMHAAPKEVELEEISDFFKAFSQVKAPQDLHVWSVSTTDILLTVRLHCPDLGADQQDEFLEQIHHGLSENFGISHATIEVIRGAESEASCTLEG